MASIYCKIIYLYAVIITIITIFETMVVFDKNRISYTTDLINKQNEDENIEFLFFIIIIRKQRGENFEIINLYCKFTLYLSCYIFNDSYQPIHAIKIYRYI